MDDSNKILITAAIPLPEVEEDDDRDLVADAELRSDLLEIINSIGTPEFKPVYLNLIQRIKEETIEIQAIFCRNILAKINEVYGFELIRDIDILNQETIDEIYKMLEFIEYDHVNFLSHYWSVIVDENIEKISSIDAHIRKGFDDKKLELMLNMFLIPELVKEILRTNNKESVVGFLVSASEKSKFYIAIKNIERRSKNGEFENQKGNDGIGSEQI